MAIFSHEGDGRNDHILLDGSRDWAVIPKGVIRGFDFELPIRVLIGDTGFGYHHVFNYQARRAWMEGISGSIENFIYTKLGQSGDIFESEGWIRQPRFKVVMRSSPSSILIFEVRDIDSDDPYLSFVTAYHFNRSMREYKLGRYVWRFRADNET